MLRGHSHRSCFLRENILPGCPAGGGKLVVRIIQRKTTPRWRRWLLTHRARRVCSPSMAAAAAASFVHSVEHTCFVLQNFGWFWCSGLCYCVVSDSFLYFPVPVEEHVAFRFIDSHAIRVFLSQRPFVWTLAGSPLHSRLSLPLLPGDARYQVTLIVCCGLSLLHCAN